MFTRMVFALLILWCQIGYAKNFIKDGVLRDKVDLIEINHFYDEHGRLVFDQEIFWEWSWKDERHNVRAWRLIKVPEMIPSRDWSTGGYRALWMDGSDMREVKSDFIRETWEQFDVELLEREFLPKEKRRELKAAKMDKPSGAIRPK